MTIRQLLEQLISEQRIPPKTIFEIRNASSPLFQVVQNPWYVRVLIGLSAWIAAILFLVFVFGMLLLDLGAFSKNDKPVGMKEATLWSTIWVVISVGFYFFIIHRSLIHDVRFPVHSLWVIVCGFETINQRLETRDLILIDNCLFIIVI